MGILGTGMIMVAAIFPVALAEHRQSAEKAQALDLFSKAEAMLHNRLDPSRLWFDTTLFGSGEDSPWLLLPFENMEASIPGTVGQRVPMPDYADFINGAPALLSSVQLSGTDVLSDRFAPANDAIANTAPNRLLWYGFYRQLASGAKTYTVAICKQRRNQQYLVQDFSEAIENPWFTPTPVVDARMRYPVPWRVTVSRLVSTSTNGNVGSSVNALFNTTAIANLVALAPKGSKLMIHGEDITGDPPGTYVPAGRILTVIEVGDIDPDGSRVVPGIRILEDIGDIPGNDPEDPNDGNFSFDVWLFPPAAQGNRFGAVAPVLEWKASL